jgi:hypothetical protein
VVRVLDDPRHGHVSRGEGLLEQHFAQFISLHLLTNVVQARPHSSMRQHRDAAGLRS